MATTRVRTLRRTPTFDFLFGSYSYSNWTIPYFQITASLHDAAQHLRLISEMPNAASICWSIEELLKIRIDWPRVERKMAPHLRSRDQPHFFSGVTAVLLPMRDGGITGFDGVGYWDRPTLDNESQFAPDSVRQFGSLSCGYWSDWTQPSEDGARLGQLCWNTDQMCAVVIDGQHRLAAIQEVAGGASRLYRQSSIPVLLVVMHPDLGFNRNASREALIDMMRRLFIDLNKHARTVSRARQILLDDRDPASICVRTVVGSELRSGDAELHASPPVLPLTLVDWHSEQAKFDEGPYLTTILGLDWAVANLLVIRPFEDPMAFEEIEGLINKLEGKLGVDLAAARARLADCRRYERPFSFVEEPLNELQRIAQGFRQRWCRPLIYVLTQFLPYRALIDLRRQIVTLRPEFANWYALKESADDAKGGGRASRLLDEFESHLANREDDPVAIGDLRSAVDECTQLKAERQLAFTVVFQRALVLAFAQMTRFGPQIAGSGAEVSGEFDIEGDLDEDDEEHDEGPAGDLMDESTHELERVQQLVAALNHLVSEEPDFLKKECEFTWPDDNDRVDRFWLCSLVQPEGPIDFTQGASKRASDILLLVSLFWLYHENEGLGEDDFDDLMERADEAASGIDLKLKQCLNRMWLNEQQSIAGRILSSRDQDAEDEDLRWDEIRARASWLWGVMCR